MPKLGMEPIRREQICRAAASVISRAGFAGTTIRGVAEEAGVSTGMLNHYFANRRDLLSEALTFVSARARARLRTAIEDVPAGPERLGRLLESALAADDEMTETWRVWIVSYGEAVRLSELRNTMDIQLRPWYRLLDFALEGLAPVAEPNGIPWSWRLDAFLNGLVLQAYTSGADLDSEQIGEEVTRLILAQTAGPGSPDPPP